MRPAGQTLHFYRPFLPMFGGIFCCLLGVGASLATVPFFVLRGLHGGNVEVGVAVAALSVAAVVGRPVAGRVADRHGYKVVMLAGTVICVLAGAAYYGAVNPGLLVAVRILHGAGEGTVYTGGAAWLVSLCPAERRGRVVGLYGICMWLGITLGTLAGTVAMRVAGFHAVWGLCVVAGAAGFLSVVVKAAPPRQRAATVRSSILPAAAVMPGIAVSLAALGYAALAAFVSLHMLTRGVPDGIAAFDAFGFTYIGVRLFIGNTPDRLGPRRVAFWSALVEAVGLIIVALAPNLLAVIAGGLVIGAGLSLLFPSLALIVINASHESQRGAALGAFTSFWDLGIAVGAPAAGLIASLTNYADIYYVMAAFAVASAALAAPHSPRRGDGTPPPAAQAAGEAGMPVSSSDPGARGS
ncbi:MAG TPA: MFS transporter [Streptosporangiaceae bacterium]|nr:MFS transporter [Streptosporangiaceae bacterium]